MVPTPATRRTMALCSSYEPLRSASCFARLKYSNCYRVSTFADATVPFTPIGFYGSTGRPSGYQAEDYFSTTIVPRRFHRESRLFERAPSGFKIPPARGPLAAESRGSVYDTYQPLARGPASGEPEWRSLASRDPTRNSEGRPPCHPIEKRM